LGAHCAPDFLAGFTGPTSKGKKRGRQREEKDGDYPSKVR